MIIKVDDIHDIIYLLTPKTWNKIMTNNKFSEPGVFSPFVSDKWLPCTWCQGICIGLWGSLIPGFCWCTVLGGNRHITRYLVFYNTSPPSLFLSLDLLWEYWIQHGANGPLYVTSCYSTWIFCRGVSGFATDCPCDVWCRGSTTCLLHVGPPFGNRILNNSWAVGLT